MALILRIENTEILSDGVASVKRMPVHGPLYIGRDRHLGWTLPDAARFISGRHCEIHQRGGAYLLHDVSTNGTFVNGGSERINTPRQLCDGDRIAIGVYVVSVEISADEATVTPFSAQARLFAQKAAAMPMHPSH